MSGCRARVTLDLATPEEAQQVGASVAPDDDAYVSTAVDGARLEVTVEADDPGALRAALDDVLACLDVARDVGDVGDDPA